MEAQFYKQLSENRVQCTLCPRDCIIVEGQKGACKVRENKKGKLYAMTYAQPCSMGVDPMEKKPLYHFLPGTPIFSIATAGCNLFCKWCQNDSISHPENAIALAPYGEVMPEEVIKLCKEENCKAIAFTYTEPTIFYEYMLDIAKLAKKEGIKTVMVSNGYINPEPLQQLIPYLDAANIDLKTFSENNYLTWTSAKLSPVLKTMETLKKANVHLEITTLIVPGVNDGEKELEELYAWVAQHLGKNQVVHISRFFPHYKVKDKQPTPTATLEKAASIAKKHLHYTYIGNIGGEKNTLCHKCGKTIITRGWETTVNLTEGKCVCGQSIAGIW